MLMVMIKLEGKAFVLTAPLRVVTNSNPSSRRRGKPISKHIMFLEIKERLWVPILTYGAEIVLRSCQLCSPSGTPQHFMEPEGSIPPSQEPSTGPYPEPYQSNPHHPILFLLG
jgi:hypothetical protein